MSSSRKYMRSCLKDMHEKLDSSLHAKQESIASPEMVAYISRPGWYEYIPEERQRVWKSNPDTKILEEYLSSNDYSKGVRSFSVYFVQRVIRLIRLQLPTLDLVSVGSGMGKVERVIEILHSYYEQKNSGHKTNVICIDPEPMSFSSGKRNQPFHPADFSTVSDMVSKLGYDALNQILFLNWCPFGESTFDYDAIIALEPTVIVSIFETFAGESGCAGGSKFYEWYKNIESGKCDTYVIEKSCHCFNGGLSLIFTVIRKRTCCSLGMESLRECYEPYTSFDDGTCSIM